MITFDHVSVDKGEARVLSDLSLSLSEHRIGVIGRNGSGKSTFARLINGLEKPTSGTVTLFGETEPKTFKRHVGFVFQNPDNQIVYPNVAEDLAFGLKSSGLTKAQIAERIDEVLERFGLAALRDRLTHQLSGGEKQMIALAGVLVMQPRLIVFDEPTTLLDLVHREQFRVILAELAQQAVVVSHDLDLVADFDRLILIEAGRVLTDGPPSSVIEDYQRRSRLGSAPC